VQQPLENFMAIANVSFSADRLGKINWTVSNLLSKFEQYANASVQQDIADVQYILQLIVHVGHCMNDDEQAGMRLLRRLFLTSTTDET
jgi:hypothetical protein